MAAKYSKAPISQLSLGFFLSPTALLSKGILFELIQRLLGDYPTINTHPVFPIDELTNGTTMQAQMDYAKTGFSTYRLISEDAKWQILILQDMVTLHWNRQDEESVGNYPGFSFAFDKFKIIYNITSDLFKKYDLDFEGSLKSYYLVYTDRVDMEPYKSKGLGITDIINVSAPNFYYNSEKYSANNYWNRYSTPCDILNGYSLITVNSPSPDLVNQILIVENKLKGFHSDGSNIDKWFDIAHDIQCSFFENIFKSDILKSWE